jgi:PmbA protein
MKYKIKGQMDMNVIAEDVVKRAMKKGCDSAEVFIRRSKSLSVESQDGRVEALESSRVFGMALKVIRNQRMGFSFTTDPDAKGIAYIIDNAVSSAGWTAEDPYLDIPGFEQPQEVLIMDEGIKKMQEEEVIKNSLSLEKAALDTDERIKKVRKAGVSLSSSETSVFNSRGVKVSYESGLLSASVTALAEDGNDSQTGWDFAVSRNREGIDYPSVARGASGRALELLGARKISTVQAPVILEPSVAVDFLGIFSASLSAEAVQKNRSFLAGKAGKRVVSPVINIIDDGLMPWGIGTKPVDDEGVPALTKTMVSKGSLTGFIHNSYTARKQGVSSTGNASRGSFKGLPGISVTNLYMENSKKGNLRRDKNDLIKSLPRGLVVLEAMGVHTANRISGEFSIGVSGLWIENGEAIYPVKEAVISGNILELFNRVEDAGSDLRFYGKTGSPSILIGGMDISA